MAEGLSAKRRYERRSYALKVAGVARVCRRMEGGETVSEICRDPTMPGRSTLMSWLAQHPELRAQVEAVRAAYPDLHARRSYHRWSEPLAAEVLGRIADGRGLREVCAEADMPTAATVTRWLNARPAFAAAYARAREAQADTLFDLAWRIACEAGPAECATARLKIDTIKWRIGKLVPRKYGPWMAGEGGARGRRHGRRDVRVEIRKWAYAPDGVKDITVLTRGMTPEQVREMTEEIEAGRLVVPANAELADDEWIHGVFILSHADGRDPDDDDGDED